LERIRQHLKFARCGALQRQELLDHLITVAQALPRATALRHAAYRWLQEQRVVRPGRTTLRDVMNTALETALQSVYTTLSCGLSEDQEEQIEALLIVTPAPSESKPAGTGPWFRSRLEQFKTMPRKESPEALLALLERLTNIASLGLAGLTVISSVHPATRRILANWGYRYDVWGLRRFASPKRNAIVLCFLQAARAETTDAVIEM
jgi:hypothetical protein